MWFLGGAITIHHHTSSLLRAEFPNRRKVKFRSPNQPRSFVQVWPLKKEEETRRAACVDIRVAAIEPKHGSHDRIVSEVARLRTPRRTVSKEA
jgi:hypothetical protein